MPISQGTWRAIDPRIGFPMQPINETSTTKLHEIGTVVKCVDIGTTAYGEAEFIYLQGVASTAVGDLVVYTADGNTTRTVARSVGPAAVAMSANVLNQFGWYQRRGKASIKSGTVAADKQLYLTATAGQVDDAVVAGDMVFSARSLAADDTGLVLAVIGYPSCGDIDNA